MEKFYPLNRQQFQAVSALASHQRYRHFIGRVVVSPHQLQGDVEEELSCL